MPVPAEALILSQPSLCGICGGQIGTGTGFSLEYFRFPCKCRFTNNPYTFIRLPHMPYNLSKQQRR